MDAPGGELRRSTRTRVRPARLTANHLGHLGGPRVLEEGLHMFSMGEQATSVASNVPVPKGYRKAVSDPTFGAKWHDACTAEFQSLIDCNVLQWVKREPWMKILRAVWVFRVKPNADGTVDKLKARWCADGSSQRPGFDCFETYSPVARMTTVRVVLALAAARDWPLRQLDVKTAYLNGDLDEELYIYQPEGFERGIDEVCRILKSLYGLRQAGRC